MIDGPIDEVRSRGISEHHRKKSKSFLETTELRVSKTKRTSLCRRRRAVASLLHCGASTASRDSDGRAPIDVATNAQANSPAWRVFPLFGHSLFQERDLCVVDARGELGARSICFAFHAKKREREEYHHRSRSSFTRNTDASPSAATHSARGCA